MSPSNTTSPALNPLKVTGLPQPKRGGKSQDSDPLGWNGGNQPLAAASATATNHRTSTRGRHASPETVGPLPLDVAGLIGAFHFCPIIKPPKITNTTL